MIKTQSKTLRKNADCRFNQVAIVHQGPKKRLRIDHSTTVNWFTLLDAYPLPNIDDLVNNVEQAKYYSSLIYAPPPIRFLC